MSSGLVLYTLLTCQSRKKNIECCIYVQLNLGVDLIRFGLILMRTEWTGYQWEFWKPNWTRTYGFWFDPVSNGLEKCNGSISCGPIRASLCIKCLESMLLPGEAPLRWPTVTWILSFWKFHKQEPQLASEDNKIPIFGAHWKSNLRIRTTQRVTIPLQIISPPRKDIASAVYTMNCSTVLDCTVETTSCLSDWIGPRNETLEESVGFFNIHELIVLLKR